MISRVAKQTEQDSDRQDDRNSSSVKGDTNANIAEVKDDATNQTFRDAQVPKKTSEDSANSSVVMEKSFDRAASETRHAHTNAHDRTVDLAPSEKKHSSYPYFPMNYRFQSHHSSHNYYKTQHYHRNINRSQYYYHHHHHHSRSYPSPVNSSDDHSSMAPFDDTTLATSNISNKKTSKKLLTVDTTPAKTDMKQRHGRYPFPYPPSYYPPSYSDYNQHPASYSEDDVHGPRQQRFEFYDNESPMEYDFSFSTTPISIDTPLRSNTSFRVEPRNRNEGIEEEQHAHPKDKDAVSDDGYHAKWRYNHNGSGYYNQHPRYTHSRDYSTYRVDSEQGEAPSPNKRAKLSTGSVHPPEWHRRSAARPSTYYQSGWYPTYDYSEETHPPQEPYDRHYFSPSPPPPPPSQYPDYHPSSSEAFTARSSPMSWYEGGRGSYDEHEAGPRAPVPQYPSHPTVNQGGYCYPNPPPPVQEEDNERPGTPSSNQTVTTIARVTPGKATGRKSPRSSDMDSKVDYSSSSSSGNKAIVTPAVKNGASTFAPSSPFGTLRDNDIVCGRGAPTNFHIGNSQFKELVLDYHRSYFVAKRSDKPRIAMRVLDILASRGARFVRRIKGGSSASSHWEEVAQKIAYEKVCQALRDAGGAAPRKMLSSVAASALKPKIGGNQAILGAKIGSSKSQEMKQGEIVAKKGSGIGEEEKENGAIGCS